MAEPTGPVAIVGMGGRFPGARDLDEFWRNVRSGVEALEELTEADLDRARVDPALRAHPSYVRRATVLADADHFDASFFGFSPREAQVLDPQQRVFLECAWEALENAGHAGGCAGESVGVYAGVGLDTYLISQLLANRPFLATVGGYQVMLGNDKDFLATRVSYKLDLRGPSVTVQTACSTSLVAVAMAARALQRGECDMALAGGVAIPFPQRAGHLYEEGMILSPDGHCRPFDEAARGTRSGAGAGVVVLRRLADAVADRDTIHAVILGVAVNNDGAAKAGYTAPSIEGQVEVIATAQAMAGVEPRSIGYLEAHGTGTPLGDPIEVAALTQVFRAGSPDVGFCRLGSLKASIGHLDAAAGVASLIKTVLVLQHREIPPLVNFRKANPKLGLETSPFTASATAAPWPSPAGVPRRAGVSSFGIGGTNAHVVVEEAPAAAPTASARGAHLLVLSARTPAALARTTADLASHLAARPGASLADVEWTLKVGRKAFPERSAVVVRDASHAAQVLADPGRPPVLADRCEVEGRPVAFLFSGQGSQHAGMGAGLYRTERAYREVVDRCAAFLEPHLGLDLRQVLLGAGDGPSIDETRLTQPALFVTELALASLWKVWGITPAAMLGHSIGEYVAAHLAGVLSLEDALLLVAARGRLMQGMPAGSMAAVHLAAEELEGLLAGAPGVELAAVNAPGLCTIAGPAPAVSALLARLAERGVESRPLHTSHAFHSAMMEPVLAPFAAVLEGVSLSPPVLPYLSNLTGTWITPEQATSRAYYAEHLRRAVRFEDGVRALATDAAMLLLEVGPGNALASLSRLTLGREGPRRVLSSLAHPRERRPEAEAMLEAAGKLWLAGADLDWKGMQAEEAPRRVPLPTYPFERRRHWVEALPEAAGQAAPAGPRTSSDVGEWLYAPTWTRDDTPPGVPRLDGTWLVLSPPGGLADAVARRVTEAGAAVVRVEPGDRPERLGPARFQVRPGFAEDLGAVLREVRGAGGAVAGAVHLWTFDGAPAPAGQAPSAPAAAYHALVAVAAALDPSPGGRPVQVIVATRGAASVLDEQVERPETALLLGPVLSLPTEVPGLRMRAVDLRPGEGSPAVEAAAREIVEEAAALDGERVVARRAGRRWVRRLERVPAPAADAAACGLRPGGVYAITGGLGGVGLTLARWLASAVSARLLLTARSPLPPREAWDAWLAAHPAGERTADALRAIREIERAGGEVLAVAADAADEAAMGKALDEARSRWGRLDGVIHAAGVPGNDRVAFRKDAADVAAVLSPKVDGLAVLTRLLGGAQLDFVVLVSSITAVFGSPGVCDYAAANAVFDAFAESSARPPGWRQVVSVGYSAWREVGMAARLVVPADRRRAWDAFLRAGIAPAAGADALARVLASGRRRVVVAPFDLVQAMELARNPGSREAAEAALAPAGAEAAGAGAPVAQDRPALATAFQAPGTETERRLAAIWSELLGVQRIGVHDDFFQLGGHSLLATRVLTRIDGAMGARLTLRDVFEAPTLHQLARRVELAGGGSPGAAAPQGDREELEF